MAGQKTACVLCANGCGLEVQVEGNRIVKVRGDQDSPISEGYICRKGNHIAYHQHHADRVLYPLKRVGDGFERVPWDQVIGEIAERLREIVDRHGPRVLASMTGGGGFSFLTAPYPVRLMRRLGSRWNYSAANQEFSGRFWAHGLTFGNQGVQPSADLDRAEMLMLLGKNPMMSHDFPQARRYLRRMSRDPERLLVVVDPRLSETARLADIHLALRPGTDALLLRSMISIILEQGLHDRAYLDRHADGFPEILPWFAGFDVRGALAVCELDYDVVARVAREFATRRSVLLDDLGILMNRHSALVSYLIVVLLTICGRIGVPGGNQLDVWGHAAPDDPKAWRAPATGIPAINGTFPPNILPEEIMSDHPDRIRAVLNVAANPLRSYADTTAYEEAFRRLDLLVVADIAMSETAALAHYVLPCKTAFEAWDGSAGDGFPRVHARMRRPVVVAEGEQKETGEVITLLADALGLIPPLPDRLHATAASGDLARYGMELFGYLAANPDAGKSLAFIVGKTLGPALGSVHLAGLLPAFAQVSPARQEEAARAGFAPGPDLGLRLFQAILDHPEGVLVGVRTPESSFAAVATPNGKIRLHHPEVEDWIRRVNPADEEVALRPDPEFPLVLMAGRRQDTNSNTNMRDPAWNRGKRTCTLAINPRDAEALGLADGQGVRVVTEAGEETIEVEVTEEARQGQVIIPHGFGLVYDGVTHGTNVNRLTKNTNRDFLGTPMHRYVPCRVEAL
jgi:anaerobic selenocysteine-containing dehydrogenase